jgi:2-(1,2-epoxy-1,2-dihydrophenyl)acetyl-CoA isomerase
MTTFYERLVEDGLASDDVYVHVEQRSDRALVRLADPEKLNVLSAPLVQQLKLVLSDLAAERDVKAIVLTGADPGFSAGGDLRMMEGAVGNLAGSEGTADIWRWIRNEFGAIARLIARTDKAFVAALNGPAAGVGLAWALTCDRAIASDRAIIVPAFGRLGLLPEVGTSWALTRALGYQGAFGYYASGEPIDAQRALQLGLVQEVVPHDELLSAADAFCDMVAALPSHALQMTKPLLRAVADASWDHAIALEEFAEPTCFTTAAFAGAVQGMMSKA